MVEALVDVTWAEVQTLQRAGDAVDHDIQSKFAGSIEAAYSGLSTFFGGLEGVIGGPSPKVHEAMATEHTQGSEADELFTPARETLGALAQRADAFLHEIRGRPEKHIAVVSHSSFFLALFNATLDTARAPELREWFDNGAMRVAHVAYD